ncbi:hypothetical protein SS50377_28018 [Spironucleus salmonicida]|uniref:Uncharacterized protein n=1 Tax=Spironucleus salmonicida TaxID=348837 RepID=A0A9P8LKK3_9EUKA|nr:hypothetical protein SS50377_28018 [Spironucleus salmonicida]
MESLLIEQDLTQVLVVGSIIKPLLQDVHFIADSAQVTQLPSHILQVSSLSKKQLFMQTEHFPASHFQQFLVDTFSTQLQPQPVMITLSAHGLH